MKRSYLCIILFLINLSVFARDGYKQNLAHILSINFPSKPTASLVDSAFTYRTSNVLYIAWFRKSKPGLARLKEGELDGYYDSFIKTIISKNNGKLISRKTFEIKGLKGIEIEYISNINPNLPNMRFDRYLFINDVIFSFNFLTRPGSDNKASLKQQREQFFNSLTVTADQENLTQGISTAAILGELVGNLLAIAFVLLIIAGIVFLVYKLTTIRKPKPGRF